MQLNDAPTKTPIADEAGKSSRVWIQWFSALVRAVNFITPSVAPSQENGGVVWVANDTGTKDGQAYAEGDVLVTSVKGGVSKTALLADWSAL